MVCIAHRDATTHAIGAHNVSHASRRLRRVRPLRLGDQRLLRNAAPQKVVTTYATFAEIRIQRRSPRRNHDRSHSLLKQFVTVIETSPVDGRGASGVLCGPKDNDDVGFIFWRLHAGARYPQTDNTEK